jgi:FecR protein
MLKRGMGQALLVLAVVSLFAASAAADSHARIVRLSFVEGNIQMDQRDGRGLQKGFLNMPIGQGTILLARDEGRAEVEFENGSTIRLAHDSQIEFQQLGLRTEGQKFSAIDVTEGTAYFDIKKKTEDEFVIYLNGQQITAPKSARFRLRVGKDSSDLAVFKGEVEVQSGGKEVEVRKNESIELDRNDQNRYFLSREITTDPLDAWDLEREKYRDQYFAASTYQYNPAYSYGYADLSYWGAYEVIPVYGRVWRPYFVNVGWQPFADGAWVWYPHAGYVWVSSYPWGWAPYRYGSWVFVGGRGWCWRPGVSYVSWYTVPVIHRAPPMFIAPRPPAVIPPHREPILVGHGGPGPVHPGDGGRGRWYRDDDPIRGGGGHGVKEAGFHGPDVRPMQHDNPNNEGGKKEVFTGPDVRPMPHEDPKKADGGSGKKEVFPGPDVRPMPHEDPNKDNGVVGKKDGGSGPDVHPAKREDDDAREQGGGKRQVFTGPDVRPMPHENPARDGNEVAAKDKFTGPDVRPMPHGNPTGDGDVREEQRGNGRSYSGPDVHPMPHENPSVDSGVKREVYNGPDARPMPHGSPTGDTDVRTHGSSGGGPTGGGPSGGVVGVGPSHSGPRGGSVGVGPSRSGPSGGSVGGGPSHNGPTGGSGGGMSGGVSGGAPSGGVGGGGAVHSGPSGGGPSSGAGGGVRTGPSTKGGFGGSAGHHR